MHTDPSTGEITTGPIETHDAHGRPWGVELWPGGPINGGVNWREFVAAKIEARVMAIQQAMRRGER